MSEENGLDEAPGTPLASPRGPLTSPLSFGRYRLIERIGAGGMAEIWRAVAVGEQGFERAVAIKRIREEVAEMADIGSQSGLSAWTKAMENTVRVAEMCNLEIDFSKRYSPVYRVPKEKLLDVETPSEMKDDERYLRQLCEELVNGQWRAFYAPCGRRALQRGGI